MPTLDERIAAARKLEGYTPGPWKLHVAESFDGRSTFHYHEVWTDDLDVIAEEVYRAHNDGRRDSMRLIAAAPDLHCLALDLAAERERLLATLRRIAGKGDQVYCRDGHEECALLARAALAPEPRA